MKLLQKLFAACILVLSATPIIAQKHSLKLSRGYFTLNQFYRWEFLGDINFLGESGTTKTSKENGFLTYLILNKNNGLQLGLTLGYDNVASATYYSFNNNKKSYNYRALTLASELRGKYGKNMQRKLDAYYVIGIGFTNRLVVVKKNETVKENFKETDFVFQATPIGIVFNYNSNHAVSMELGWGYKGFVNFGYTYTFKNGK